MLKGQSHKLGGISGVQRSILQKQQIMYTPQEFNFYHNLTLLPKSIYNKNFLFEKSTRKFMIRALPKLEKKVFHFYFDLDAENEVWPCLTQMCYLVNK